MLWPSNSVQVLLAMQASRLLSSVTLYGRVFPAIRLKFPRIVIVIDYVPYRPPIHRFCLSGEGGEMRPHADLCTPFPSKLLSILGTTIGGGGGRKKRCRVRARYPRRLSILGNPSLLPPPPSLIEKGKE